MWWLAWGRSPCSSTSSSSSRNLDLDLVAAAITPEDARADAGALLGAARRHGCAVRARARAGPARGRGCGARHRLALARQADRQLRRSRGLQLPSQQEHDQYRGRCRLHRRRAGRGALRAVPLSRHQAQRARRDRRDVSGREEQPDRRRGANRHGPVAASRCVQRSAGASSPRAISRSSTVSGQPYCRRAATRGTAGTCFSC